jgi:hypothetical protein
MADREAGLGGDYYEVVRRVGGRSESLVAAGSGMAMTLIRCHELFR